MYEGLTVEIRIDDNGKTNYVSRESCDCWMLGFYARMHCQDCDGEGHTETVWDKTQLELKESLGQKIVYK